MANVICISDVSNVFYWEESGILGPVIFFTVILNLAEAIYTKFVRIKPLMGTTVVLISGVNGTTGVCTYCISVSFIYDIF